jgi:hypothetical protein
MQQLTAHLTNKKRKFRELSLTDARLRKKDESHHAERQTFNEYFKSQTNITWKFLLSKDSADYVLLVNKTQVIYKDYAVEFWNCIKATASYSMNMCGTRIIFFAVYGNTLQVTIDNPRSTLFTPNKTFGTDFLQCTPKKTKVLIEDHNWKRFQIPIKTYTTLHEFTGHIHAARWLKIHPPHLETHCCQAGHHLQGCLQPPPFFYHDEWPVRWNKEITATL